MDSQPTETAEIHIVGLVDDAAPNKKDGRKRRGGVQGFFRWFGGFLKEVWVLNTLALLLRILTSLAHVMRISVMCGSSLVY